MFVNEKKIKLIDIFNDTKKQYETNNQLIIKCKNSIQNQKVFLETNQIENINKHIFEKEAQIIVSPKRTLEAASNYKSNVCILNFASSFNPGGGVKHGSSAQEECICRCSTLYYCLDSKQGWDNFYIPHRNKLGGLHNDDIIYTPDVTVFKSDELFPQMMEENKWYNVNVITCAAPDLYSCEEQNEEVNLDKLKQIHIERLRRILDVALYNKNEVVILGAFGCGAFGNPPEIVALAAKEVLADYLYAFKTIEFAIYCNKDYTENFITFNKILLNIN